MKRFLIGSPTTRPNITSSADDCWSGTVLYQCHGNLPEPIRHAALLPAACLLVVLLFVSRHFLIALTARVAVFAVDNRRCKISLLLLSKSWSSCSIKSLLHCLQSQFTCINLLWKRKSWRCFTTVFKESVLSPSEYTKLCTIRDKYRQWVHLYSSNTLKLFSACVFAAPWSASEITCETSDGYRNVFWCEKQQELGRKLGIDVHSQWRKTWAMTQQFCNIFCLYLDIK